MRREGTRDTRRTVSFSGTQYHGSDFVIRVGLDAIRGLWQRAAARDDGSAPRMSRTDDRSDGSSWPRRAAHKRASSSCRQFATVPAKVPCSESLISGAEEMADCHSTVMLNRPCLKGNPPRVLIVIGMPGPLPDQDRCRPVQFSRQVQIGPGRGTAEPSACWDSSVRNPPAPARSAGPYLSRFRVFSKNAAKRALGLGPIARIENLYAAIAHPEKDRSWFSKSYSALNRFRAIRSPKKALVELSVAMPVGTMTPALPGGSGSVPQELGATGAMLPAGSGFRGSPCQLG